MVGRVSESESSVSFTKCPLAPTVCLALGSALERWGDTQADSLLEAITWPQFPKAGLHSGPSHPSCSGAGMWLPPQELLQEPDCYPENPSHLLSVCHAGCFAGRERDFSQLKNILRIQKRTFLGNFFLKCFPLENQSLSSLYPLFLEEFVRSFYGGGG